jgi:hypothetical protein
MSIIGVMSISVEFGPPLFLRAICSARSEVSR